MLQKLLGDTSFHRLLQSIDEEVAEGVRSKGCRHCGAALHSARYERKPRGGPSELPPQYERRASFCWGVALLRRSSITEAESFISYRSESKYIRSWTLVPKTTAWRCAARGAGFERHKPAP